jgi:hypothetical protein
LFNNPIGAKRQSAACLLLKKSLDLFWQRLNIIRKKVKLAFKIVGIGETLGFFSIVEIGTIILTRKELIINIRPKRDDGDHVLIITTDVDHRAGRTTRTDLFV